MPNSTTKNAPKTRHEESQGDLQSAGQQAMELLREYTKQRPDVVVLWAFGIGFVLGWKLKPW